MLCSWLLLLSVAVGVCGIAGCALGVLCSVGFVLVL